MFLKYQSKQIKPRFEWRPRMDPNHPLSIGCVGFWLLNETGGLKAYDLSGNLNHGTLTNGPTWVPGRTGQALSFDGSNDYIAIPDSPSVDIGGDRMAISLWFKANAVPGNGGSTPIVFKDATTNFVYQLNLCNYDNVGAQLQFAVYNTAETNFSRISTTSESFSTGIWYHVVGVLPGAGSYLLTYINGVDKSEWYSGAFSGTMKDSTLGLNIGTDYGSKFFNGIIDDVRIYRRALSPQEVRWLYRFPYDNLIVEPTRKFWFILEGVILSQSAFRFFNDDASESDSTPAASEDTGITYQKGSNLRLRIQIDASGDPPSQQYQLEYRKQGSNWRKIPIG
jgi:hypothetical protein